MKETDFFILVAQSRNDYNKQSWFRSWVLLPDLQHKYRAHCIPRSIIMKLDQKWSNRDLNFHLECWQSRQLSNSQKNSIGSCQTQFFFKMYLSIWKTELQRERKETERARCSIHRFSYQMATMGRAGLIEARSLEIHPCLPSRYQVYKHLNHIALLYQDINMEFDWSWNYQKLYQWSNRMPALQVAA